MKGESKVVAGIAPNAAGDRLRPFVEEMFHPLARADQRAKAALYLRGLLLDGGRKSMQPMAARLGVDHQALQQFITSSTWDFAAVRAIMARRAELLVQPLAWVFGECVFHKDGNGSPGVARQYTHSEGRVVNCQLGVTVQLVGTHATAAVNWRLLVPESWDDGIPGQDKEVLPRRRRCGIPEQERNRPMWTVALDLLDELAHWGLRPPAVLAGSGLAAVPEFHAALRRRGVPCPAPSSELSRNIRRRARINLVEMKDEFGLDHFEGRSWTGWNRHVTLCSVAYLYAVSRGVCPRKRIWIPGPG